MTMTLYEMQISPHARKVRLLASELGLKLDTVQVDPRIGETRSKEFLSRNPNGRVPTLDDDGFVLYKSPAIMKYLAAKKPERGFAGKDAKTQALIDQWICWWVGGPEAAMDALAWELLHQAKFPQAARQRSRHHGGCACAASIVFSPCSTSSSKAAILSSAI